MAITDLDGISHDERRGGFRRRALLRATASFDRGFRSFDATIRNISEGGARLEFGDWPMLPDRFDLRWERARRSARVVWRNQMAVGVAFD